MDAPRKTRDRPVRMPPLVPVFLVVVLGIVTDTYGRMLATIEWATIAAVCGLLGGILVRRRWLGAVAILGAWGALAGGWNHERLSDRSGDDLSRAVDETPRPAWIRGVIREGLGYRPGRMEGDQGVTRFVVDLKEVNAKGVWRTASGRAMVTALGDRSDLKGGMAVEGAGSLASVAGPLNPGEFDYKDYLRAQGVRLRLSISDHDSLWNDERSVASGLDLARFVRKTIADVRTWSQETLRRGIDPRSAPLAEALLLGRREGVDPDVNDAFATTGTTHLLAISGLHMQVLAVALGFVLMALGVRPRMADGMVATATIAYVLLIGFLPSVVRSAAMTVTYCFAGMTDRKGQPANTTALAALATLALNPADLFDVGCQLSFLAVGVIVWVASPLNAWLVSETHLKPLDALERRFEPKWKTRLRSIRNVVMQGLVISTVVWLAALPLVALRFHLISPIGILLNVPLVPLTSLALLASGVSLALAAIWAPLAWPAGWIGGRALDLIGWIVNWGAASRWGHAFVPGPDVKGVLAFYLGLFLFLVIAGCLRWRLPGRKGAAVGWVAAGLGLAIAPSVATTSEAPSADVLAVGHGLAVVIGTSPGCAVLYDCGRMRDPSVGRRIIAPALWARGVSRLDAVILSHADADHYDGLPDLLDRMTVSLVLVPAGFAGESNPGATALLDLVRARGIPLKTVAAGEAWTAGATRFAVLHPAAKTSLSGSDNARSIVLDVSWSGRHLLLTGDLDGPGLSSLTASPPPGPIDVLLSPHHGGITANPARLFDWSAPSLVVVSQRPPSPGTRDPLRLLDARGIPVLRTWERGALRLNWTHDGITAEGFLDRRKEEMDVEN